MDELPPLTSPCERCGRECIMRFRCPVTLRWLCRWCLNITPGK